jgi:hypothetical protein
MSDTTTPAPVTPASPHWWDSLKLAASSVYHSVLKFETNVSAWVTAAESNPNVKALIDDAVALFEGMVGVSPAVVNTAVSSAKMILAMLSQMAAADSTVTSGSSPSQVVQPAIPAPPPAVADVPTVSEGTKI